MHQLSNLMLSSLHRFIPHKKTLLNDRKVVLHNNAQVVLSY